MDEQKEGMRGWDDLGAQGVNAFVLAEAIGAGGSGSGSAGGGTIGVGSVVGLDASRGMLEAGDRRTVHTRPPPHSLCSGLNSKGVLTNVCTCGGCIQS